MRTKHSVIDIATLRRGASRAVGALKLLGNEDRLLLLAARERARGERDHHGVVAGEQHVHADDLGERYPERRIEEGGQKKRSAKENYCL